MCEIQKASRFLLVSAILISVVSACRREAPSTTAPSLAAIATPAPAVMPSPEAVFAAPVKFKTTLRGTLDEKLNVHVELERNGDALSGAYFYEKAGAINIADKTLSLKGRIDKDGNVTLGETVYNSDSDKETKTGEFKGRLETVATNGGPLLRFTGAWTGTRDKRPIAAAFREVRYDLGGLQLAEKRATQVNRKLGYELRTTLPQLTGADTARTDNFNNSIAALVASRTGEFRKLAEEMARDDAALAARARARAEAAGGEKQAAGADEPRNPCEMEVGYTVTAASREFISILLSFYEYTGGAHPNTTTTAFNYDLTRNQPVKLADLFAPRAAYLKTISDYCIRELKKLKTVERAEDGAAAREANFDSWNLTPAGLRVTFDRYQVASYAAGDHEVVIPYSALKPIIKADGLLAPFANR